MESGLLVLGSILAILPVVLLLIVVLKVLDSIPHLDPIRVYSSESRVVSERSTQRSNDSRTVQSPPVRVDADETTDHVP